MIQAIRAEFVRLHRGNDSVVPRCWYELVNGAMGRRARASDERPSRSHPLAGYQHR